MNKYKSLYEIFAGTVRLIIDGLPERQMDKLEEIRLRAGKPLALNMAGEHFFAAAGKPRTVLTKDPKEAYIVTGKDLVDTLTQVSEYSPYAFEEEIRNGFITVRGGHRVGICGKAVAENADVRTLRSVSSLNVRVSHEIKGSADNVMKYVVRNGAVRHTLIISPPGMGKTTLLRDIVRQLSSGIPRIGFKGADVGVVDERSEIAGMYMGIPQNDVGIRTDVLDCCPKARGMQMLLRSMSPSVVAVDEIGSRADILAIEEILNAGISLICTVHGDGIEDIKVKPYLSELIEKRMFKTYIVLTGGRHPGETIRVYDETLKEWSEVYGALQTREEMV